jgi:hypothetical protein
VELWAYSIFGARERRGFVKLVRDREVIAQVDPQEARQWARNILEAAEAAETDEYLMHLLIDQIHLDDARAVAVLQDFREYREKKQAERS